ncbi:putative 3-demethylubiquinol 3-O-methyltransferase (plasmid) [Pseudodesulfovibrio profundus]|uniref:Putative 3-demethylubiquinol 3-O-methyltransferase n=1 Tax=Pseudodesulfovibrio profundus TaxID=57320 RepID=A0A2C8FEC1_9BACT|nr:class I SAM-dependent methyltransferase [Pseudodesulfovibrio profundus]SOB62172.1 putative 3-demethylubiquinol 3-O-methyltransferase [Pseudodesulfovibrio profundus]
MDKISTAIPEHFSKEKKKRYLDACKRYNDCTCRKINNKHRGIYKAIRKHPSKNLLDVGCGDGYFACFLAKLGYNVTGIDLSKESLSVAKSLAKTVGVDKVNFSYINAHELWRGSYDAAYCFDVVEHILWEEQGSFLESIYNRLKPKGAFFVRAPHAFNIRQYIPGHIGLPTYEQFMGLATEVGFTPKVIIGHSGIASIINYAIPYEKAVDMLFSSSSYWRYTFMKYLSLANVVVKLEKK